MALAELINKISRQWKPVVVRTMVIMVVEVVRTGVKMVWLWFGCGGVCGGGSGEDGGDNGVVVVMRRW
jgi:hypothetical protein